eukprot:TRINITY_DN8941_c0_g1_i5.p1 TRINITY_DN8941_c0_g1~~TRINITY_DN8941_c0_g1_i5.p1  ORF type:complete len:439 (-),score=82.10 TRINITY_DN8941_c0_g1_i5:155-1471(-)
MATTKQEGKQESNLNTGSTKLVNVPNLSLLYFVVLLDLLGVGLVSPLVTTVSKSLNLNPVTFGIINSTYAFSQLLFNPVMGRLSDKMGRKIVLLISLAGTAVSYMILGTAKTAFSILVSRVIVGIVKQTLTLARACASDVCEGEARYTAFGNIMIFASLAFVIGPFCASPLSTYLGQMGPVVISTTLFVLDFIVVLVFFPGNPQISRDTTAAIKKKNTGGGIQVGVFYSLIHTVKQQFRDAYCVFNQPSVSMILVGRFVQSLVTSMIRSTFSLIVLDVFGLAHEYLGYTISYLGTLGVMSGFILNHLSMSKSQRYLLSSVMVPITLMGMSFTSTLPQFFFAIFVLSFFMTMLSTVTITCYSENFKGAKNGLALGVWGSFDSIGGVVGPLIGGSLFQYGGIFLVYSVAGFFSVISFFVARSSMLMLMQGKIQEILLNDD